MMRRLLAAGVVVALLAVGTSGCTALLTGGKKKDPEKAGLETRAHSTQLYV
ncbi:MAG: hypothetical protein AAF229_14260 [Pseudomonadota bacterium]